MVSPLRAPHDARHLRVNDALSQAQGVSAARMTLVESPEARAQSAASNASLTLANGYL